MQFFFAGPGANLCSMGQFKDLPDDEKVSLMRGPYGRELLKTIQACAAPLHWENRTGSNLPTNGSAFVVKTDTSLFGVTAKHVCDAFEEQAEEGGSTVCKIYNLEVDLRRRLISRGKQCDLATFEIGASELARLDRRTVPWPPAIPPVGKAVLFAGFPGLGKRLSESGLILTFGVGVSMTRVDGNSENDISMVRPPDDEVIDVVGKGLPPRCVDMGGMSGGPVFAVLEDAGGIISWALAGVIYEYGITFDIIKAVKADRIGDDGTIHE